MLEKHLNIPAYQLDRRRVESFLDVCWDTLKPNTAKTRIWLLKAAWDWGRGKCELSDLNPWDGVAERFKSVPVQPVPAFSKDEVRKILNGFRTSPHYANYLDYVRFRLSMATRPQEVRDLKWSGIAADFSSAWFVSNKTKKGRTVPLDPSIASMLMGRRDRLKPASDDELVFTSREGLPIDNRNFRRIWTIVLAEVGVPYRKPYTTRKTSVRHSLLNGGNYIEVAAAAGHDPHTMHKYYGDAIQQNSVLVSF
jgi:integrase